MRISYGMSDDDIELILNYPFLSEVCKYPAEIRMIIAIMRFQGIKITMLPSLSITDCEMIYLLNEGFRCGIDSRVEEYLPPVGSPKRISPFVGTTYVTLGNHLRSTQQRLVDKGVLRGVFTPGAFVKLWLQEQCCFGSVSHPWRLSNG